MRVGTRVKYLGKTGVVIFSQTFPRTGVTYNDLEFDDGSWRNNVTDKELMTDGEILFEGEEDGQAKS